MFFHSFLASSDQNIKNVNNHFVLFFIPLLISFQTVFLF